MDTSPVDFYPKFYDKKDAKILTERLKDSCLNDTEQTTYKMYGKITKSPRKMAWYSDNPAFVYKFSPAHITPLVPKPVPPVIREIQDRIEETLEQKFNAVLLNIYSPEDSLSWHSDDDAWLGDNFVVPSVTFLDNPTPAKKSERRVFKMRENKTKRTLEYFLDSGSLVVMKEGVQKMWQHCVPARKRSKGLRYNLTFRNIIK